MKTKLGMTYAQAGVSYADIDQFKVLAQRAGTETALVATGPLMPLERFRGESAYVLKTPFGEHIGHVEEGLGTKVLLADLIYSMTVVADGLRVIAMDTVAMIVNDLAAVGIPPSSVQMQVAVGSGEWLKDSRRAEMIVTGWKMACLASGAAWTGGETPVLTDIVHEGTAVICGSAVGYLPPGEAPFEERIRDGDIMIGLLSSGIHANGITLLRRIGAGQADHGKSLFVEALKPTAIYVRAVRELRRQRIMPHYAIHVTGHGWRKLMRAEPPFRYVVDNLPKVPEIFRKLQKLGNISEEEMWGNYNMGVGYVFIVNPMDADRTLEACRTAGYRALRIGHVKAGKKKVFIRPEHIVFEADSMQIR